MTNNNEETKRGLTDMHSRLAELEAGARKLQNQNLADIIASAKGRVHQLFNHPDLELLEDAQNMPFDPKAGAGTDNGTRQPRDFRDAPKTRDEAVNRMRNDGDSDPESTARMNWPHLFDSNSDQRDVAGLGQQQQWPGSVQDPRTMGGAGQQFDPRAGTGQQPGSIVGGPDRGKEDTYAPGDPRFTQQNRDFRQPNAVDLNPDGTLRQAPNSHGAARDVRD